MILWDGRVTASSARVLVAVLAGMAVAAFGANPSPYDPPTRDYRYLTFQIFTSSTDARVPLQPVRQLAPTGMSKPTLANAVQGLVDIIGDTGTGTARLGFVIGPVSLDHPDDEMRRIIRAAFEVALEKGVAVGFHIDDSMFWEGRGSLAGDPASVEWISWQGTPNTGREIVWGTRSKIGRQLCFNSVPVVNEVRRVAQHVIGAELRAGLDRLGAAGREDLFAGVIVGWETQLGRDFDTGAATGYRAMTNLGHGPRNPPSDPDAVRQRIVEDFVDLWTGGIFAAGIPVPAIFSHIWVVPRESYAQMQRVKPWLRPVSYLQVANFAPVSAALRPHCNPGYSLYSAPDGLLEVQATLAALQPPRWAMAEGTNFQPFGSNPTSDMTMESYLAQMFNRGATLVNLFSWGIGGDAWRHLPVRLATEGADALSAYRKFLRNEELALPR